MCAFKGPLNYLSAVSEVDTDNMNLSLTMFCKPGVMCKLAALILP